MKLYIAGPMRGIPYYNFPAFDKAAEGLRALGHTVVSPAELDREAGVIPDNMPIDSDWNKVDDVDLKGCVLRDIAAIPDCEGIVLLPGWEASTGAKAELALAEWLKLPRCDLVTGQPLLPGETRVTDPKTGGQKGQKLARMDLIPGDALWAVAELYGKGAAKYSLRNWEKGYNWSLSFAALQRHVWQYWQNRETMDKELGCHHMACVVFHALAMLSFSLRGIGTDDRPVTTLNTIVGNPEKGG